MSYNMSYTTKSRTYYDLEKDKDKYYDEIDDMEKYLINDVINKEEKGEKNKIDIDKLNEIILKIQTTFYRSHKIINLLSYCICIYDEECTNKMIYLLKNVGVNCIYTRPKCLTTILEELKDNLPELFINIHETLDQYKEYVWDKDILEHCKNVNIGSMLALSYYRKNVERNSRYLNWLLSLKPTCNEHIKSMKELNKMDMMAVVTKCKKIKNTMKKETFFSKSSELSEYYFYSVIGLNKNSIRTLDYSIIGIDKDSYTVIRMKKYRQIKSIVTTFNESDLSKGVIYDKLLIKYVLKRLQHLFNKCIIHGDMKVGNILINTRTKNKCIIIDYEHSLDMSDNYFHSLAKAYLLAEDISTMEYKVLHGQRLYEKTYSYKNDVINTIYSIAYTHLCSDQTLDKDKYKNINIKMINDHINKNKFYLDLINTIDLHEDMTNDLYNLLIQITNYHIMMSL